MRDRTLLERLIAIIGMPRSGTTWLHQRLRQHSRIVCALDRVKEIHYLDTVYADQLGIAEKSRSLLPSGHRKRFGWLERRCDAIEAALENVASVRRVELLAERARLRHFVDRFAESDQWYGEIFRPCPGDWCLDSTPAYFLLPDRGFAHLQSIAHESRFILILRNPYRRTISGIRHRIVRQQLDWDDWSHAKRKLFVQAVAEQSRSIAAIRRIQTQIPARKLLIHFFEEIGREPEGLLRRTLAFAELDYEPACMTGGAKPPNPSPKIALSPEFRTEIFEKTRPMVLAMRDLGLDVPAEWAAVPDGLAAT